VGVFAWSEEAVPGVDGVPTAFPNLVGSVGVPGVAGEPEPGRSAGLLPLVNRCFMIRASSASCFDNSVDVLGPTCAEADVICGVSESNFTGGIATSTAGLMRTCGDDCIFGGGDCVS